MSLNIIFAGTPPFALPCLDALLSSHHHLKAIYTQPDRKAGRGRKLQASSVKMWGITHHVPVYQPSHFKEQHSIDILKELAPDILVVIAYGLILPPDVLNIPRYGAVNVHASLLPRWRGASPIQHAILHGDNETGVTLMQMDENMDTGDILATVPCLISPDDTAGTLHDKLSKLSCEPLLTTLDAIAKGRAVRQPQNSHFATYAPKIAKTDALINWEKPAINIIRQIHAYNPWPIAFTRVNQTTLRIHQARFKALQHYQTPGTLLSLSDEGMLIAALEDAVLIERIQFPGENIITLAEWNRGGRDLLKASTILGRCDDI
jgi:methionyl-tRNA formyltransferase